MLYRQFLPGIALALMATPTLAETVRFAPDTGSTREYQTEISTRRSSSNEPSGYFQTQFFSGLIRFIVTGQSGDTLNLRLYPEWVAGRIGSDSMNSAEIGPRPAAQRLMREGLDATIDNDSGALKTIRPHGDQDLPPRLMKQIEQQLATPAAFTGLEAKEGWQTQATAPGLPKVTLTVTRVTPQQIFARFEGQHGDRNTEQVQLAGLLVLDRKGGWLDRQVMTLHRHHVSRGTSPHDAAPDGRRHGGATRDTAQTIVLARTGNTRWVHADEAVGAPDWRKVRHTLPPLEPLASADQVLAGKGVVQTDPEGQRLLKPITATVGPNVGRLVLRDLVAFDGKDRMAVRMLQTPPEVIGNFQKDGADWQSYSLMRLTGGADARRFRHRATEVRAQMDWFPVHPFEMTLKPGTDGRATARMKGATARLMPLPEDAEGDYELLLSGQAADRFEWAVPADAGVTEKIYAGDRGPDWLTPTESRVRRIAQPDPSALRVVLRGKTAPQRITIRVNRTDGTPAASRQVVFQTTRGQRLDPDHPPQTRPLFGHDRPPATVDRVKPQGLSQAALTIRLDALQARHCALDLAGAPHLAGHGFNSDRGRDGALFLQTDDGVRRHFYGLGAATAELTCDARQSWRDADLKPDADHPWMLDPAHLDLPDKATLQDLRDRWRFVNALGTALMLAAPEGVRLAPETPLSRLVWPDGHLHIAGTPVKFRHGTLQPGKIIRRFDVTFPALPKPAPAPWTPSDKAEDAP